MRILNRCCICSKLFEEDERAIMLKSGKVSNRNSYRQWLRKGQARIRCFGGHPGKAMCSKCYEELSSYINRLHKLKIEEVLHNEL